MLSNRNACTAGIPISAGSFAHLRKMGNPGHEDMIMIVIYRLRFVRFPAESFQTNRSLDFRIIVVNIGLDRLDQMERIAPLIRVGNGLNDLFQLLKPRFRDEPHPQSPSGHSTLHRSFGPLRFSRVAAFLSILTVSLT